MSARTSRLPRVRSQGAYVLLIELGRDRVIRVGALGEIRFPKGKYVYVGSAMSGIEPRVARHVRREKKEHWHVDRLTTKGKVVGAWLVPSGRDIECALNHFVASLTGTRVIAPGFGSSDCSCASHLHLVDEDSIAAIRDRFGPLTPASTLRGFGS